MDNSHTLTGRTMLVIGTKVWRLDGQLESGVQIVRAVELTKSVEVRMGVHPQSRWTVYHPVINGDVKLGITWFPFTMKPKAEDFLVSR